jgi:hypothetical protein
MISRKSTWYCGKQFQRRFSTNVWCDIVEDILIVPVIIDHMTEQNYPDFLQKGLPEKLQDIPLATRIVMCFQHDGASCHFTRHVMQHFSEFP